MVLSRPELLEDRRVERLRQAAHVVERRLRDLADLAQVGRAAASPPGACLLGAAEHRAHGGQDLPELVVQLARDLPQRRLARRDQLSARRSRRSSDSAASSGEQPPVRANQVEAGAGDGRERRGQNQYTCRCDPVVDVLHLLRGLLLALVVLHQQPRHGGAERRLPRLQRQPDLRPRLGLLPARASANIRSDGVPELRHRVARYCRCSGVRRATATSLLPPQRIVQIAPDAIELRRPRGQRIAARRCRACRASPARAGSDRSGCAAAAANPGGSDRSARSAAAAGRRSAGDVPRVGQHRDERDDHAASSPLVGDHASCACMSEHYCRRRGLCGSHARRRLDRGPGCDSRGRSIVEFGR